MAAPVQRDQELELTIDSLAYGGNGVARLDGFVVFVRRGLPGDTVRARVTKVQRRHAEALATEVLSSGPQRVEAPCAHYPACGGCRFQDLAYDAQVATKEQWVRDSLQRLAGLTDLPLEPILPAASLFGYRNKMEYSFAELADGPTLGLHKAGRWDEVLEIQKCWLTTDLGNAIRNRMRDWAREEKLPAYDQETHEGYLRHLLIREGRNTGQALVQLVTNRGERFDRERLIEVLTEFPEVRSIHWSVNTGVSEVTNLPTELLWGEDAIEEEIGGLRYRVRPNAFIQTNTEMAEQLYGIAREFAGLTGGETVYDLYCGIGTIGLSMAADALTVWGIEISEESVACAIENQELNAIGNTAFFAGNVGEVLRELRDRAGAPDVVVVDPPRAGLAGKALKRLGELEAPRIVYVSCNPTTLAGDLKRLGDDYGYRLVRAKPVDMFPHTPHVECVALLERLTSYLCKACGTQYPPSDSPPGACPICEDQRQYIPHDEGQQWVEWRAFLDEHKAEIRDDHGILGIGAKPSFAIGQRALLVKSSAGNVLWDCTPYLDDEVVARVSAEGGLAAIAISHPHYYASMVEWAHAFGCPIHLHEAERKWVMRPDPAVRFWDGETNDLGGGLTLDPLRRPLRGRAGAALGASRRALLAGDIVQVIPDRRYVSFMYSYPNLIPLPPSKVQHIADALAPFAFDTIYGAWFDRVIERDGSAVVRRSVDRYVRAVTEPGLPS